MSSSGEMANNSSNNSNNASTDFKRKRNFTEEEKNFLVELVQRHQQIITSKDNKSSMKILKDKVWSEIHSTFNDNNLRNFNNSTRTLDQLKKCWENLRTKAKREYKQLSIVNNLDENNLQHKIISIIGDELDHSQNPQSFEFGDSFAIDYESDFNIIGNLNQNLQDSHQLIQSPNKQAPQQMRQILVNKLISKQQQLQQDDLNDEMNENESLIDEYRIVSAAKKNPIIGKQQLIVEGELVKNPEDVVVENENDLADEMNGDELLDEDEDLMDEIEDEIGYEEDLQYEDEEADMDDDVDEIVYEEDGMLTSVVRNKSSSIGPNSKQSNNSYVNNANGNLKRLKSNSNNNNSTIEDGHSSSNHSNNNSVNNFKYSPQNNKKFALTYQNNARTYSNGILVNKSTYKNMNNKLINNNISNSNLNEALSDLKLREQRTRLRMARLELIANRRRAQLELELAMAKLENERRKKQLLERQLENEQLTHRIYRKKIDK